MPLFVHTLASLMELYLLHLRVSLIVYVIRDQGSREFEWRDQYYYYSETGRSIRPLVTDAVVEFEKSNDWSLRSRITG